MSRPELSPIEILALHQSIHRELSGPEQERFLAKPEVAELAKLTAAAVQQGLRKHRMLHEALPLARSIDFWFRGEPCDEDGIPWCARCKPTQRLPPTVIVSRGWTAVAFHARADCSSLGSGQRSVERRGGSAAPTDRVALGIAIDRGLYPCLTCIDDS